MTKIFSDENIYNTTVHVLPYFSKENAECPILKEIRHPAVFEGLFCDDLALFRKEREVMFEAYLRSLKDPTVNIYEEANKLESSPTLKKFTLGQP